MSFRLVADGFMFLESPRWYEDRLYFSDFYRHEVFTLGADGTVRTVCEVPNQPSGLGFTLDGALLVASMLDRRILRHEDGRLEVHADLAAYADVPLNDMLVDADGRAYVGNFGFDARGGAPIAPTRLIVVDPDGSVRVAGEDLVFPNGMAITPDGRRLLVAETYAGRISAFALTTDGMPVGRTTWASLGGTGGETHTAQFVSRGKILPDGVALDAEGALWVGDANGTGAIRVAEGGRILDRIDTGLAVYAVALGGPERRTLYLCASPSMRTRAPHPEPKSVLLACDVDVPGAGLP
jgi:sugar lactone lactonase YvrE